jgi:hypothetical protein
MMQSLSILLLPVVAEVLEDKMEMEVAVQEVCVVLLVSLSVLQLTPSQLVAPVQELLHPLQVETVMTLFLVRLLPLVVVVEEEMGVLPQLVDQEEVVLGGRGWAVQPQVVPLALLDRVMMVVTVMEHPVMQGPEVEEPQK